MSPQFFKPLFSVAHSRDHEITKIAISAAFPSFETHIHGVRRSLDTLSPAAPHESLHLQLHHAIRTVGVIDGGFGKLSDTARLPVCDELDAVYVHAQLQRGALP
jgi:hypothetical protein